MYHCWIILNFVDEFKTLCADDKIGPETVTGSVTVMRVVSVRVTPLPAEGYRTDALKPEPLDHPASEALFFRLSESPALAGDEFRKNSEASRRWSR